MNEDAMKTDHLPCVKAPKRRGEEIRRALRERELLRTDARITADDTFIYLPLVRALTDAELEELGGTELTTREFALLERRKSIEDIVGFKPSYEVVGDIIVLTEEVPAEKEEHKIADALIRLHRSIKVVAKRISAVEGVYRTRRLAVIAGEQRTETMHTENACKFKLDLEKVYFNPRLARERNRVASQTAQSGKPEEIIDMFAGVGPFAIQIAKRAPQSHVTAIDINPDAIRYLTENMALNRVQNVDAVVGDIRELHTQFRNTADRIIMNLPKSAYLFLREALSMLKPQGGIIHFYDLESAYPADDLEKHKVIEIAMTEAKEKLLTTLQEMSDEFPSYSVEIAETRKVKPYAPYAYIIGIDVSLEKYRTAY
ncbi:MAG: class I SAM-dependent methyltransferase family protein [Methanomicrobia archaeon]|nr:class I SAM-dependent methyltransferase family protein [Methanomicrobia archaeon]